MLLPMCRKRTFQLLPYEKERVFACFLRTVELIDQNDARTIFSSDSLPHMGGMAYDSAGKHLLAYNTTGNAYLYSVSPRRKLTRLFPQLKLKMRESPGELSAAFFEKWCWYIDNSGRLCRLDMEDGSVKRVAGFETKNLDCMVQVQDMFYLFYRLDETEDSSIWVEEYSTKEGELFFQRCHELYEFTNIFQMKKDYDRRTTVLSVEKRGSHCPELAVFDPSHMSLDLLNYEAIRELPVLGFHTYLEKDLVALACIDGAVIARISSGKVEARYTKEDKISQCCDALFLNDTDVMFASWNGIYLAQPDEMWCRSVEAAMAEGEDWEKEMLEELKAFQQMLADENLE